MKPAARHNRIIADKDDFNHKFLLLKTSIDKKKINVRDEMTRPVIDFIKTIYARNQIMSNTKTIFTVAGNTLFLWMKYPRIKNEKLISNPTMICDMDFDASRISTKFP